MISIEIQDNTREVLYKSIVNTPGVYKTQESTPRYIIVFASQGRPILVQGETIYWPIFDSWQNQKLYKTNLDCKITIGENLC